MNQQIPVLNVANMGLFMSIIPQNKVYIALNLSSQDFPGDNPPIRVATLTLTGLVMEDEGYIVRLTSQGSIALYRPDPFGPWQPAGPFPIAQAAAWEQSFFLIMNYLKQIGYRVIEGTWAVAENLKGVNGNFEVVIWDKDPADRDNIIVRMRTDKELQAYYDSQERKEI